VGRRSLSCDRWTVSSVLATSRFVASDDSALSSAFDSCPDGRVAPCNTSVG
jgi:hypothetical protein